MDKYLKCNECSLLAEADHRIANHFAILACPASECVNTVGGQQKAPVLWARSFADCRSVGFGRSVQNRAFDACCRFRKPRDCCSLLPLRGGNVGTFRIYHTKTKSNHPTSGVRIKHIVSSQSIWGAAYADWLEADMWPGVTIAGRTARPLSQVNLGYAARCMRRSFPNKVWTLRQALSEKRCAWPGHARATHLEMMMFLTCIELTLQTTLLCLEAQSVVGLRVKKSGMAAPPVRSKHTAW